MPPLGFEPVVPYHKGMKLPASLLLIVGSALAQQSSSPGPSVPSDLIPDYSLQATSFIDALLKIASQFRLPLGVEWIKSAGTLKPDSFFLTHTTVKDIIDAVVSTYSGYEWRMEEDGIVNVFQRDLVKDGRNPLNVTIKSFDHTESVNTAGRTLHSMLAHIVRHPDFGGIATSGGDYVGAPVVRFTAENVAVRTVLAKIITAPPPASKLPMNRIWIATFPDEPMLSRTGYLEVAPTLNFNVVSEQPFWNLFQWGDPPLKTMER